MCGIAGFLDDTAASEEKHRRIRRMCDAMVHRGPDDHGYHVDSAVALGMRRLSIVDLAGGHQPQRSPDGAQTIVFNGEIFNHHALRAQLRKEGAEFSTNSDTEVILRLFERKQEKCLEGLNGMFAIAIWDQPRNRLFIARDRLGVKPLYYFWDGVRFAFASEARALFEAGVPRSFDPATLALYFSYRYVPQPSTCWQHVHKVMPGHFGWVTPGQAPQLQPYWSAFGATPRVRVDDATAIAEFTELFEDSVRLRLIADVPVGVMLSGGLDSSAVLAAACRERTSAMKTFSVGYSGEQTEDERQYARLVASHLGAEHHEVELRADSFVAALTAVTRHLDEPLADWSLVPLYLVCELARRHVKVVLSGEGSDEFLGGYHFDKAMRRWQFLDAARAALAPMPHKRVFGALPRGLARALHDVSGKGRVARWRRAWAEATTSANAWLEQHPPRMTHTFSDGASVDLLRPEWRGIQHDANMFARHELDEVSSLARRSVLQQSLGVYQKSWMVDDLLTKADRVSMAHSLELRTPFLDYRLAEWSNAQPDSVKVRRARGTRYETKWVLRRYAENKLPASILARPKMGFPAPVPRWLAGPLRGWMQDTLQSSRAALYEWCEPRAVRHVVDSFVERPRDYHRAQQLWTLLSLEVWLQTWSTP